MSRSGSRSFTCSHTLFWTVAAILLASAAVFGQFNCAIQGVVTDPSGSVVPGAAVHVTNVETGVSRDVTTSAEGLYRVLSLGPGTYTAEVSARGFRPVTRPD